MIDENMFFDDIVYGILVSKDILIKEGDVFYKDEEFDVFYFIVENDEIF